MKPDQPAAFAPFGRIALSLSGGGFRAAAYSLGALSYLHHLQGPQGALLDHVCHISSASGGSITNAFYALGRYRNVPFTTTYHQFIGKLAGENLVHQVLDLLQDNARWQGSGGKQRNLINAFARVYDESLFEGAEMSAFLQPEAAARLQVSINATEFYRGLWFRFHNGVNSYKMGNNFVYVEKPANGYADSPAGRIKVGDVVAASSCFPVGFEPMLLPGDFAHCNLSREALQEKLVVINYEHEPVHPKDPVGLMDGGITDNQGLRATMDANGKMAGHFDLVIVTDVTSYFMEHYKQPEQPEDPARTTITGHLKKLSRLVKAIRRTAVISILVLVATIIAMLLLPQMRWPLITAAAFIFPIAATSLWAARRIAKLHQKYEWVAACTKDDPIALVQLLSGSLKAFSKDTVARIVGYFTGLSAAVVRQMIAARVLSTLSMVLDINLKHTRRLIYDSFYKDKDFDNRRCANFIYELSAYNARSRNKRIGKNFSPAQKEQLSASEAIQDIAEQARTMGTTLWFGESDVDGQRLKQIIVTGQFTTCANLLEYCISLLRLPAGTFTGAQMEMITTMHERLLADWLAFKQTPDFLYTQLEG